MKSVKFNFYLLLRCLSFDCSAVNAIECMEIWWFLCLLFFRKTNIQTIGLTTTVIGNEQIFHICWFDCFSFFIKSFGQNQITLFDVDTKTSSRFISHCTLEKVQRKNFVFFTILQVGKIYVSTLAELIEFLCKWHLVNL